MQITERLLQSCLAKDRAAQRKLYELLLPYLRAVALRYLRDNSYTMDALQDSFVKIFNHLEKYDADQAAFKSWAAKIVINSCLNYNQRVIGNYTEELIVQIHETPITEEKLGSISDKDLLVLMKKMPPGYFEIFNLFITDGYTHKEIAEILNISEAVSRKKLSRAKNWLRKKMLSKSASNQ